MRRLLAADARADAAMEPLSDTTAVKTLGGLSEIGDQLQMRTLCVVSRQGRAVADTQATAPSLTCRSNASSPLLSPKVGRTAMLGDTRDV